jgi:hypothetical protein
LTAGHKSVVDKCIAVWPIPSVIAFREVSSNELEDTLLYTCVRHARPAILSRDIIRVISNRYAFAISSKDAKHDAIIKPKVAVIKDTTGNRNLEWSAAYL